MGHTTSIQAMSKDGGVKLRYTPDEFQIQMNKLMKCSNQQKRNEVLRNLDEKIYQNPNNTTGISNDVCQITESFVLEVLQKIKALNPLWDFTLLRSGSFYDGLRVGLPFEFDFMLELRHFPVQHVQVLSNGKEFKVFSDQLKHRFCNMDAAKSYAKKHDNQLMLHSLEFKEPEENNKFGVDQEDEIGSFGLRYSLYSDIAQVLQEDMKHCTDVEVLKINVIKDTNPNFCLFLRVKKQFGVMVDLVPCFKFPVELQEDISPQNSDWIQLVRLLTDDTIDSEDIRQLLYLVCTNTYWRVSYSLVEQWIMQRLSDDLKMPLRILKYFSNLLILQDKPAHSQATFDDSANDGLAVFGYHNVLKSYPLKCVFLENIREMKMPNGFSSFSNDTWSQVVAILHRMVFHLSGHNVEYLVIYNSWSLFGKYILSFTMLTRAQCEQILEQIGEMLHETERDGCLDRFPMINYPKHVAALTMP